MASTGTKELSDGTYGISGIPLLPNVEFKTKTIPYAPGMPVRQRLSDLAAANNPMLKMQWTLFILALEKFKALPVEQKLSYFQIAGIHGYPATSWDGADPPADLPKDADPFYCAHNSLTFPTWHRPYMLVFEKLLWSHMKDIIKSWDITDSERTEWNEAADTWRLPYWDWARKQTYNNLFSLPESFTKNSVTIYPPNAKDSTGQDYLNPLWGFENPEKGPDGKPLAMGNMPAGKEQWNIKDDDSLPWSQCSGVSRYGIKQEGNGYVGLEGINDFEAANASISSANLYNPYPADHPDHDSWVAPGNLADAVNRMFSLDYNRTWATFASTKWWNESEHEISTGYMSLEYIHNNVHNLSGGTSLETGLGHMSDVPVAAFDPLFWLHHCNVDRLLSMWQALHWDAWWTAPSSSGENATDDPRPEDPLQPFHNKDNGDPKVDLWTSEQARDWTKLNYQYDNLVPNDGAINEDGTLNEEKYKRDLLTYIETTYPSTKTYVQGIQFDNRLRHRNFFEKDQDSWDDYIINVVYDRYALNGRSYAIQFWLKGSASGGSDSASENMIGQVYAFAGLPPSTAEGGGCANCGSQRDNNVLSRAQVPITVPIMVLANDDNYTPIRSMRSKHVEDYLKDNLYWKFVQLGGAEKLASDFPNTKISIWRGIGKPQDNKTLPAAFSSYHPLHDVTNGKDCGLKRDDAKLGVHAPNQRFRHF